MLLYNRLRRLVCFILPLSLCLLLVGCHQRGEYVGYFKNPNKLQQTVSQCQKLGKASMQSKRCVTAIASAMVIDRFVQLEKAQGRRFGKERATLIRLQEQIKSDSTNVLLKKQLLKQQQKTMLAFSKMAFSVQENFSKVIMKAETQLSVLKRQYKVLSQSAKASKVKLKLLRRKIKFQSTLIEAMLVFVNLNTGG